MRLPPAYSLISIRVSTYFEDPPWQSYLSDTVLIAVSWNLFEVSTENNKNGSIKAGNKQTCHTILIKQEEGSVILSFFNKQNQSKNDLEVKKPVKKWLNLTPAAYSVN